MCADCRAKAEREARVARMAEMRKKSCAVDGCPEPRAETPTQVRSYCIEHHREFTRKAEERRRREAGAQPRIQHEPPSDVAEGSKWCWGCDKIKSVDEFHADAGKSDGLQAKCKVCQYERYQERLAEDPEAVRAVARRSQQKHRRRRMYGMDEEQFLERLAQQGGMCLGCHRPPVRPVVDHDHSCCGPSRACEKCVRGILCSNCNTALGLLGDDSEILKRLIRYLESSRCTDVHAAWCPIHGDCTCETEGPAKACPLHDTFSMHGESQFHDGLVPVAG